MAEIPGGFDMAKDLSLRKIYAQTMNRSIILLALAALLGLPLSAQSYWNRNTQIKPLALPMPGIGEQVERIDLNSDGKQDAVRYTINGGSILLWLDDDGNMKNGDFMGDVVNDCILIDRDADGKYDFIVKFADLDGDSRADVEFVLDYTVPGGPREWSSPHYMVFFDDDKDGVMNYIDWNDMALRCWEKNGLSDFYPDYSGEASFMKVHTTTHNCMDLRYNWENPFIFYDPDKDGLSEMALRYVDQRVSHDPEATAKGVKRPQYRGRMGWYSVGIDLDNDNCPGNDIDFDMTLRYGNEEGAFFYREEKHPLKNMRGLPEADCFFPDPRIRLMTELIYPSREKAFDMAYKGNWKFAYFTYDEDDDCSRWERVELYENKDAFKLGTKNGGVDNHPQADVSGDRGEWDEDFSGGGNIYVGRFDGRIHLYGAERGVWRIDQNTNYYQGYHRTFQNTSPTAFATVEYLDSDGNGFLDTFNFDLDGDRKYEWSVSLGKLGIDDRCTVIDVSKMNYRDYTKLFSKVSSQMWKNALAAVKLAKKYGVETFWYNHLLQPANARERYHDGWWAQFYLLHDIEHIIRFKAAQEGSDPEEKVKKLYTAYFSGNWKLFD